MNYNNIANVNYAPKWEFNALASFAARDRPYIPIDQRIIVRRARHTDSMDGAVSQTETKTHSTVDDK